MKFRGGLRYGNSFPDAVNTTWPLASLTVEADRLHLTLPWRAFRFPRQSVTRLIKYSGFIAIGVQIEHTILEQPNLMIFWTYQFGEVKKELESKGFLITGTR